jgi:hypothetical protein
VVGGYDMDHAGADEAIVADEVGYHWDDATVVPGSAALNHGGSARVSALSCASAGFCGAGGYYTDRFERTQAFLADEAGGRWRAAVEAPGIAALDGGGESELQVLSCSKPGDCSAGGTYTVSGVTQLFVASEVAGTWRDALELDGIAALNVGGIAGLNGLSCASPGNCSAGGYYRDGSDELQAFVVDEVDGTWSPAQEVRGSGVVNIGGDAQVFAVSCGAVGSCSAVGSYVGGSPSSETELAFDVNEVAGTWGSITTVPSVVPRAPGGEESLADVSCPSAGNCSAGGTYVPASQDPEPYVLDEVHGAWGAPRLLPGFATLSGGNSGEVTSIACASAGYCSLAGDYNNRAVDDEVFVENEVDGAWKAVEEVPGTATPTLHVLPFVDALACASRASCTVVGSFSTSIIRVWVADLAPTPPVLARVTPRTGPRGTRVLLYGTHFSGVDHVTFGAHRATGIVVVDPDAIRVTVPAGSGTVVVRVTAPWGTSAATSATRYTYS